MVNLQKISSLSILLDEKNLNLEFRGDFPLVKKSVRTLKELIPYLKDQTVTSGPDPAYYVWRKAHRRQDDASIKAQNLRFDLTLLAPGKINEKEFVKTAGHYHQIKTATKLGYPEVYEVLYGTGYFLIQKMDEKIAELKEVYLIEASAGEKVLVPPGFGHVTINVYNKPLLVANWVSTVMTYNYKPYKKLHGAAYYLVEDGSGSIDILENPNYDRIPEIKKILVQELPQFNLIKSKPMYELVRDLNKLKFLNYPEEFSYQTDIKNIYKL